LRSWPAQKAGPAAAITKTLTAGSDSSAARASISSPINAIESALRAAGRLSVRVAMPSAIRCSRIGSFSTRCATPAVSLITSLLDYPVIPAKAGIHPATGAVRQNGSRLSPG